MEFRAGEVYSYFTDGQEVDLNLTTRYLALRPLDGETEKVKQFLESSPWTKKPLELNATLGNVYLLSLEENLSEDDVYEFISRLNATGTVTYATPVFEIPGGKLILTDIFVVKFKNGAKQDEIDRLIADNHVEVVKRDFPLPRWYKLRFTSQSGDNTFDVVKRFYHSDLVEYAHPDFIENIELSWEDYYKEDFESDTPNLWEAWDADPRDGEYYWGRISSEKYPSPIDDLTVGNYKCWVAAAHDPDSPARFPEENPIHEAYPPNMDAWIKFGPFDLSEVYWSYLEMVMEYGVSFGDYLYFGLSFDNGQHWKTLILAPHSRRKGINIRIPMISIIQSVPWDTNLSSSGEILFGLEFVSDDNSSGMPKPVYNKGIYLDDILLKVSNLGSFPPLTSDPYSDWQWNLHNVGQSGGMEGMDINILPAWNYLRDELDIDPDDFSEKNITVAVIDMGVDLEHEDLNVLEGYDALYASGDATEDSKGAPHFVSDGHGTACAGIIGAKKNGKGIVGVAPGVKILPVVVFAGNWAIPSEMADGIVWAVDHGANVLSNSWHSAPVDILQDALQYAHQKNVLSVFAAGNRNYDHINAPASYPETIAVGAMSPCGERKSDTSCDLEWWWGSQYGPELDVVAPGVKIPTTDMTEGGYALNNAMGLSKKYFMSFNGTSSATPHVAGVAALLLSVNPTLSPEEIRTILHRTARDLNVSGRDDATGYGLVDAFAAVSTNAFATDLNALALSCRAEPTPGSSFAVNFKMGNSSTLGIPPFKAAIYLSKDNRIDGNDLLLWDDTIENMPQNGTIDRNVTIVLDGSIKAGDYMLIGAVDSNDTFLERNEENNFAFASLKILNPPNIVLKNEKIEFGVVATGNGSQKSLVIKNEFEGETADLLITEISYTGPDVFSLDMSRPPSESDPYILANHQSVTIPVYFTPQSNGVFKGVVRIKSNDPDEPLKDVNLTGKAVEGVPAISISGDTVFQSGETSKVLTIENRGNAPLQWNIGPDEYQQKPWPQWLSANPMSGTTDVNGTSQVTLTVDRSGLTEETYVYNIYVHSNDPNNPSVPVLIVVKVSGVTPVLEVNTTKLDFGTDYDQLTFTLSNSGDGNLTWQIGTLTDWLTANPYSGTVTAGDSRVVTVSVDRNRPSGEYNTTMEITSNGGSAQIDVSMEVLSKLQIEPEHVVLDQCGAERVFTVQGGTPPYHFTLKAASGESVPENTKLSNVDEQNGNATVKIDPCLISTSTSYSVVDTDMPVRDLNITVVDTAVNSMVSTSLEVKTPQTEMALQCGGTAILLEVSDSQNRKAYASIALDGRSWVRAYGGAHEDTVSDVKPVSDGILMTGSTSSDMWVLKLFGDGRIDWQKTYGTPALEGITETIPTSDGGYLLAGSSIKVYEAGTWILKLDDNGNVKWNRIFKGHPFHPTAVAQRDTDFYITAGGSDDELEMVLIKVDQNGNSAWKNGTNEIMKLYRIEGSNDYSANDFVMLPSGEMIMVGQVRLPTGTAFENHTDMIVFKTDINGTVLWSKAIGKSKIDENGVFVIYDEDGGRIIRNSDGTLTILGTVNAFTPGGGDMIGGGEGEGASLQQNSLWVVKIDENGTILWQKAIPGLGGGGWQPSLAKTADGGCIIAYIAEASSDDYWLAKLNASGEMIWQYRFDSNGHTDQAYAVSVMPDGDIVMSGGGWKYIFGADPSKDGANAWTLRLDENGTMGCNP